MGCIPAAGPCHCHRLLRPSDLCRQTRRRAGGGSVCGPAESYVALYGEQEPQAGLRLAQEAATLAATAGSHALQGLALLHAGEGYAMLGDRRECEAALGVAEAHLQAMRTADPANGLLSADRLGRIQGSCYLALGDSAKAGVRGQ